MKTSKFFFAAMMAAAVAVGFTACEPKTPENPFEKPGDGDGDGKDTTVVIDDAITCAEAATKAEGETVKVKGYVVFAYNTATGNSGDLQQSAWLADDATATKGVIQAYYCTITDSVEKGDLVCVEGPIKYYVKSADETVIEIDHGTMKLVKKSEGPQVDPDALLQESFAENQGNFTIEDKVLPEGISYVWKWASAQYGMKASAYVNKTNYATESWLISPEVDLSAVSTAKLTFDHARKFGNLDELSVQVLADGKWTKLSVANWPAGTDWNFVASGDISLDAYVGKKVQIAFVYTSTNSSAATWEIKNVLVK